MLNGDFTAIASPACNGGAQRTLTGGFVNNQIDPSRLSQVSLNFLKHVPVSTDPCGKLQYGIPNNNTEHQGLAKVDYTITSELVIVRALFLCGVRQPGDLRRHQRPDPEPHRPEQPGPLAGAGPQSGAVGVDAQLAARHDQPHAERPAAAAVFQRDRSRIEDLQPRARLCRHQRHGERLLDR